jgi:diguanylate cyclase (GGDEF)-like protein
VRAKIALVDDRVARLTTAAAAVVAALVAVALPLGFYQLGYQRHAGAVEAEAAYHGYVLSQRVSHNPQLWMFEAHRLEELITKPLAAGEIELRRVLDAAGQVIAEYETAAVRPRLPVLARSIALYDSGRPVGTVDIRRSLRPLLEETIGVALVAGVLAGVLFLGLRTVPLRALRQALERVAYLASHDPLTGLPNRALFHDRLERALVGQRAEDGQAAVLCIDLDHFKDVNDTLGHAAGDRLLQQVTQRLQGCLRRSDTLARLGGDEFAILRPGVADSDGITALARRIVAVMAEPVDLDGQEVQVGASVGVALATAGDSGQLLQNADLALYRAKAEGRGTVRFFADEMNVRLRQRKALEHDLRRALAESQLELHYQPQIDLDELRVVGVEALLRWNHPERGMVPPSNFVPLAEETGLILPLGEWVLRTACARAGAWPGLRLAINLSPAQFRQAGLAELVARTLRETGLEPSRLELEITEGVLLHDTEATLATLAALRSLGVRIAMDDFGTGYSSLSYLRRFPFDKIKIDRSFVAHLGAPDADAIVRAIISLGRALGMRANAEGVETAEQAARLRAEGCEEVQGFHFGRPVPPAVIDGLVRTATQERTAVA